MASQEREWIDNLEQDTSLKLRHEGWLSITEWCGYILYGGCQAMEVKKVFSRNASHPRDSQMDKDGEPWLQ